MVKTTLLLKCFVSIIFLAGFAQISSYFPNGALYAQTIMPDKLYRETSRSEVYVIHDGEKIWIPTEDALYGMGYQWSDVNVVPDGALNAYATFIIPSDSATPGSLIFPPDIPGWGSLDKSHYPVKLANSTRILSRSHVPSAGMQEIQLTEIRGWLVEDVNPLPANGRKNPEKAGFDFPINLIPDFKWLKSQNIDINKVIRVGNIAKITADVITGATSKKMVSIPAVHIEVNSWMWKDRGRPTLANAPSDWIKFPSPNAIWPFNPNFKAGQYVRVFGSFVTDTGHASEQVWSNEITVWNNHIHLIDPWMKEDHYSRWTEIHPADRIQVCQNKDPIPETDQACQEKKQSETVYGLIMYAKATETNSMEIDLAPLVPRPSGTSRVAYEEIRGPEWQNANPGDSTKCHDTMVRRFNDHIRVSACTTGGSLFFGSPGRIRSLFRVWWEDAVRVPVVTDMNRMQAEQILREAQLFPSFTGTGDWVWSQDPSAGDLVLHNTTVKLQLSLSPCPQGQECPPCPSGEKKCKYGGQCVPVNEKCRSCPDGQKCCGIAIDNECIEGFGCRPDYQQCPDVNPN